VEHVVFFPGPDGAPVFRRVASLEEAVAWVERLRNDEGLAEFSVHSLTEVPLSVRTYYKVKVPAAAGAVPAQARPAEVQPAAASVSSDAELGFFTS